MDNVFNIIELLFFVQQQIFLYVLILVANTSFMVLLH